MVMRVIVLTLCVFRVSLVPTPSRRRGKEGLVHTACACAEFFGHPVHGKALRMKYTEVHVQSAIWLALVHSSERSNKKNSELDHHSPLEACLHIVSPSNAGKVPLSRYKSPVSLHLLEASTVRQDCTGYYHRSLPLAFFGS